MILNHYLDLGVTFFQRSSQNATDITFELNWDFIKTVCAALLVYKSEWVSEWVSELLRLCSDSALVYKSEWVSEWVDQTLLRLCTACHRISDLLRLYTDFATQSETSFKRLWILWLLRLNTDFTTQRLCNKFRQFLITYVSLTLSSLFHNSTFGFQAVTRARYFPVTDSSLTINAT